ncbi:MAG: hypothetical protein WC494_03805 [Candidatus Pacearchaeota archaeon]
MEKQEERRKMLEGIEKEIEKLDKQKDEFPDYANRIAELKKEKESLKKDLGIK